jgi:hypothetical protein
MEFKDYYKIIGVRCNAIQDIQREVTEMLLGARRFEELP